LRSEFESQLLNLKSSALGRAILQDEGLPEDLIADLEQALMAV
jgi:hypothetical protein